jgi:hypothetical protein
MPSLQVGAIMSIRTCKAQHGPALHCTVQVATACLLKDPAATAAANIRMLRVPAILSGNGERAAELLLLMGDNAACPDRDGFTHDMVLLFRR